MICPSCGAAYSETELYCPYCKSENKIEAKRRQLLKLKKLDEEAADIKDMPEKIVRKSGKRLLTAGVLIVVCVVIVMLFVFGFSKISLAVEYKIRQKHLDKLESYYMNQSYLEIYEYTDKYKLYDSFYEKYNEIANIYYFDTMMREDIGNINKEENQGENKIYPIKWSLSYGADTLSACKSGMEDKSILGNEDTLSIIYEECAAKLKEELKLTEDEINNLSMKDGGEKENIENLAKEVEERLK